MVIYTQLLLVASIVIFIVDLSGFSDTILDIASRLKGKRVESLKPFTCSLCMTWWVTLIWTIVTGHFSLPEIAFCAALSAFSFPIAQVFIFVREGLNKLMAVLSKWLRL